MGLGFGLTLLFASPASASTTPYYGYNFLAPHTPAAGRCTAAPFTDGQACSGFNYWDRTQVAKNSGGFIGLGFMETTGYGDYIITSVNSDDNPPAVVRRVDLSPINPYNASWCLYYVGNSSYVQCRAIVF